MDKKTILASTLLLVCAIFLSGCDDYRFDPQEDTANRIQYMKDHRTGLCFAVLKYTTGQGGSVSISYVPCNLIAPVPTPPMGG